MPHDAEKSVDLSIFLKSSEPLERTDMEPTFSRVEHAIEDLAVARVKGHRGVQDV